MVAPDSHAVSRSPSDLDALERSRRRMLMAVVAASTLWLAPQIVRGFFPTGLPHALSASLALAGMAGALAYLVFMMRFHGFQRRVLGDPELRERMNDERVIALRREAIYRGWIVLVLAVGLGVAAAPFTDLPDQATLLTLLLVAVDAPILFFLALDGS